MFLAGIEPASKSFVTYHCATRPHNRQASESRTRVRTQRKLRYTVPSRLSGGDDYINDIIIERVDGTEESTEMEQVDGGRTPHIQSGRIISPVSSSHADHVYIISR